MAEVPLPPVEPVRPGLWSIPVPIPNNPLRYVLVYAFETEKGPYLVDAGWNTDDAFQVLCDGLNTAGFDITDVQGVLVTHIHPDHYGLAGRIRESSGAWVALHPADAALVHAVSCGVHEASTGRVDDRAGAREVTFARLGEEDPAVDPVREHPLVAGAERGGRRGRRRATRQQARRRCRGSLPGGRHEGWCPKAVNAPGHAAGAGR